MKRRLKPWVKYSLIIIAVLILGFYYTWYKNDLSVRREEYQKLLYPVLEVKALDLENESPVIEKTTDVYFTNYHLGDGSSGITTASGLQIKDFEVNEYNMYTYDGKVVVATANMTRLPRGLVEGYQSHNLYEEFTIRLNDKEYEAIVLDVCGACYGMFDEQLQRYDIFTTKNWIGKAIGQVVLKEVE